ncbi:TonB-dependent receptor [Candidatus Halobeggiatoa sp. HSG11]|nr:TonB-dependent receptor [Candidatus Halobeggiatoa sp. HSG11]
MLFLLIGMIGYSQICISQVSDKESLVENEETDILEGISLGELLNIEIDVWSISRTSQNARKAPATVVVINQRRIKERGYKDLVDVLRDLPGFDIVETAGRFGEFYTIRGIDGNDRFLVLMDGHRVNPYQGTFLSTGNSLPIYYAEQIEIVYGPASVVFGADAFSAIINIITTKKENPEAITGTGYISKGSFDTTDSAVTGHFPFLAGKGLVTLSGRIFSSEGIDLTHRDIAYNNVENFSQPIKDHNINLNVKYQDFAFGFFQQRFNEANGLSLIPTVYQMTSDNIWKLTTNILWGNYKWQFQDNTQINFDLSYTEHNQNPDSKFKKASVVQYFTGQDKTFKGNMVLTHDFSNDVQLVAGLETEHTKSIPPYANDEVFGTGNSVKFEGDNADRIRQELTLRENRSAGFAQFTIPIYEHLTAYAGIRYDYSDVNTNSFNPRGGLVYEPTKDTTLKLLYGTAFQAPSLFFNYEQFIVPTAGVIMIPNEDLDNQELKTYELSIIQKIQENIILNASIYYNELSNLVFRTRSDKTVKNYTTVLQNTNIGSQIAKGFDLKLDAVLNKSLTGFLNYSYVDSTFELNGVKRDLPRISKHKIGVGATLNVWEKLTVTTKLKWVGDVNTSISNSLYLGDKKQPGYTLLNAFLSYNLFNHTKLFAKFENILNNDIEHGGLFGQSGPYMPTIYQPKFNMMLGIETFW